MISTRLRPRLLGSAVLGAFALRSPFARAQQPTPATPIPPLPPTQPASGPGGADYLYATVTATAYREDGSVFDGVMGFIPHYWIFEPADPRPATPPAATPLPVVISFPACCDFHRFATNRPDYTRSWIDHLVRRGAVVIYPMGADYIFGMEAISRIKTAVSDALAEVGSGGHVPVDLSRVAVVGLQAGGAHAVNFVAAPLDGLLTPTALLLLASFPTPIDGPIAEGLQVMGAIDAIPATTHVLLVGAEGIPDRDDGLDQVWLELARANHVRAHQRAYVVLRGDAHGAPSLVADHFAAWTDYVDAPEIRLDALDWYGTWKLLDGLMGCAFDGEWCEYAFGNTPEQRFMGVWSDGVPVNEAIVIEDPATPVPSSNVSEGS